MDKQITEERRQFRYPSVDGALSLELLSGGYARVGRSWSGSAISPPFSRLYFILRGAFRLRTPKGDERLLTEGNTYLVPSGYSSYYGCDGVCEQVYFHIRFSAYGGIDLLSSCGEPLSAPMDEVRAYTLADRLSGEGCADHLFCYGSVCETLSELLDGSGIMLSPPCISREIGEVMSYIRAHLTIGLTLSHLADLAHLSPATLARHFRRDTGMSVGEYIDRLILADAERHLRTSDLSIQAIGERYGFCDQFYFSRRFKEKLGLSPREYRRSHLM